MAKRKQGFCGKEKALRRVEGKVKKDGEVRSPRQWRFCKIHENEETMKNNILLKKKQKQKNKKNNG